LILGNKKELHKVKQDVGSFLERKLNLQFNPKKASVFPLSKGIDFLGYISFKDYILLRKITVKRFLRKIEIGGNGENKEKVINAWFAYAKHGNAHSLKKSLMLGNLFLLFVNQAQFVCL